MSAAVAAIGAGGVVVVVFILQPRCVVMRRLADQYGASLAAGRIDTLLIGEDALEESGADVLQRLASLENGLPLDRGLLKYAQTLLCFGSR